MSIVIAVVNQSLPGGPLCAMTVDSCQTRIRDPYDPSKNEYFLDVNKIHQFGNFLIAECGNPHGFAQYWRMAEGMRIAGGGIDYFMDRSAEIMQIVGRDWYRSYRQRWPDLPAEHTRRYSRTIAVIAGWSRRRGRIVMRAISDDPAQQAAMDGDGFIVSGGAPETRAGTRDYLRELLFGARENPSPGPLTALRRAVTGQGGSFASRDGILRASRLAAQHAGRIEFRLTRARSIAGPIHQMIIQNQAEPQVVTGPLSRI